MWLAAVQKASHSMINVFTIDQLWRQKNYTLIRFLLGFV